MIKAIHKILLASLVGLLLAGCDDGSNSDATEKKTNALSKKAQSEISAVKEAGTSQFQEWKEKAEALKAEATKHTQILKEDTLKHIEALKGDLSNQAHSLLDSAKQQVEAFKKGDSSEAPQTDGENDAPEKSETNP